MGVRIFYPPTENKNTDGLIDEWLPLGDVTLFVSTRGDYQDWAGIRLSEVFDD